MKLLSLLMLVGCGTVADKVNDSFKVPDLNAEVIVAHGWTSVTAECPSGLFPLSGGCDASPSTISRSMPDIARLGWSCATMDSAPVIAYALCIDTSDLEGR